MKQIILRDIKPDFFTKRGFYKWACISLGLISPQDTRTTMMDVFGILWENGALTSDEIAERLQKDRKHILYHLKKMVDSGVCRHEAEYYSLAPIEDILDEYRHTLDRIEKRLREGFRKAKTL